jgi:hypothetical protein
MALNTITKTQCITYPELLSFLEIGIGAKIWWGYYSLIDIYI